LKDTTFILAIGKFLRIFVADNIPDILFKDINDCDALLQLVEDIYTIRADGKTVLEELLYIELMNIYKHPNILHKWSVSSVKKDQ
jgi:hypothetical protein